MRVLQTPRHRQDRLGKPEFGSQLAEPTDLLQTLWLQHPISKPTVVVESEASIRLSWVSLHQSSRQLVGTIEALTAELQRQYPFLIPAHAGRLAHAYGTRASKVLGTAKSMADLGVSFGGTLTESEVRYLMSDEWARPAEDIVWRRSKLGLRLSAPEVAAIDDWITANLATTERPMLGAGGRT